MPDMFERTSKRLAQEITALAGDAIHQAPTLVVGLGNRFVTPDALGPRVVDKIYVTRHITKYMPDLLQKKLKEVSAIAPGVLGVTGVETAEVVRGVVKSVQPALIIVIDSLASRRAARISTTIQLADTGISPGSGVGNVRAELNRESLGVPVIAIGVPMVVYASTISKDTISLIADETGLHNDEEKLLDLADKVISEHVGPLIVTPKDIDTILDYMSTILADGINLALHDVDYEDVKTLLA
jgi:spore protease